MKTVKTTLFLSIILCVILISGCIPGVYEYDGYRFEITMPTVKLTQQAKIIANVFVETQKSFPTLVIAKSSDPRIDIGTAIKSPPSPQPEISIYDVIVPDDLNVIKTYIKIPITGALYVLRGQDLDESFIITNYGQSITITPRDFTATPIKGVTPLEKIKRIKGLVARVVSSEELTAPADYPYFFQKEKTTIWKNPIQISAVGKEVMINSVEFVIQTSGFLYVGPGPAFPNPLIERPKYLSAENGIEIKIQNVVWTASGEILTPPSSPEQRFLLPKDVSDIAWGEKNVEFTKGDKRFFVPIPSPDANVPRLTPNGKLVTTWGNCK